MSLNDGTYGLVIEAVRGGTTQTSYAFDTVIENSLDQVITLGTINSGRSMFGITSIVGTPPTIEDQTITLGVITNSQSLYNITPILQGIIMTIDATTPFKLGEEFTVTYNNVDLSDYDTIGLSINGNGIDIDLGSPLSSTNTTATFMAPSEGLAVNSSYVLKPSLSNS